VVVETDGVMARYDDRHLDGMPLDDDWHEVTPQRGFGPDQPRGCSVLATPFCTVLT
jgi:hypothetical protein